MSTNKESLTQSEVAMQSKGTNRGFGIGSVYSQGYLNPVNLLKSGESANGKLFALLFLK